MVSHEQQQQQRQQQQIECPSLEDGCRLICENNSTATPAPGTGVNGDRVVQLKFMTDPYGTWIRSTAEKFEKYKLGSVVVEIVEVPWDQLLDDIVNEASSKIGLYDGFITSPGVSGSVVQHDGWADLTPFISETPERAKDWADILVGYRKYIAQYQEQIIMYPLDGDLLSLFYRKDILQHFGLAVPRTWDEYTHVLEQTHGKVFENQTLYGSCVGRSCSNSYWTWLMLSQMTQTEGPWSGHAFDTKDMKPLTGEAMEQTLKWLEDHVKYSPDNEFDKCIGLNIEYMNAGQCVLSYNWGNSFKEYLWEGTKLRGDKFGVAPTPGSSKVLDRESMQLVDCDEDLCKYGDYYDDIGWVNRAPYLAYGGYACSVNNYTNPVQKRLAIEFCAFAASKKESLHFVIPNTTVYEEISNGQDPFRHSHLDLDLFVSQGYEREASKEYMDTILAGLDSDNAVIDNRFPTATAIDTVLRQEIPKYLNATRHGEIPRNSDPVSFRRSTIATIESEWRELMTDYESQGNSQVSILESYQRLRGVYAPQENYNHLGRIRAYGYTLVAIAIGASLLSTVWVLKNRKTHIVNASQPLFLVLISVGAAVLGSSIIPMGIDDGVASLEACHIACMAVPWLLVLGWTIVFSALFAKLRRMNLVFKSSIGFRRVAVTEKDVLHYFVIMLACNLALLLVWTFVAPLKWERTYKNKEESYGKCTASDNKDAAWGPIVSLIALVNGLALLVANVEAYRARQIATEYGESKYIAMAMVSILQIVMVGLPIQFLVEGNPRASYFIQSTIAFIISMSILLWMYIPKVKAMRSSSKSGGDGRRKRSSITSPGLAFRRPSLQMNVIQSMHELEVYKHKLSDLADIMKEQGLDADALFQEAGLDSNQLNSVYFSGGSSNRQLSPGNSKTNLRRGNAGLEGPMLEHGKDNTSRSQAGSGVSDSNTGNSSSKKLGPVVEDYSEDHHSTAITPETPVKIRRGSEESEISA